MINWGHIFVGCILCYVSFKGAFTNTSCQHVFYGSMLCSRSSLSTSSLWHSGHVYMHNIFSFRMNSYRIEVHTQLFTWHLNKSILIPHSFTSAMHSFRIQLWSCAECLEPVGEGGVAGDDVTASVRPLCGYIILSRSTSWQRVVMQRTVGT